MVNFRENLIRYRKLKYASARQFAEVLGIPYNTYLSYENPAKPTEPKYEMLVKIATFLDVTTDELLGYVNVNAAAERLKAYIEVTSNFKVEIFLDENGKERYLISLKDLPTPKKSKSFSKEEFVETVRNLIAKAIEYTTVEQQVLSNNLNFIFSHFLANYLKMDLISERPHDFELAVKDFPKVYKALSEIYFDAEKEKSNDRK
ncbi:MAG: helix-turn-helix transcriptional regulator [Selenomonadaceae bacterium]|nr:helix-turn-helix transcriptional regulator [Selenomonadaceae bacterium]